MENDDINLSLNFIIFINLKSGGKHETIYKKLVNIYTNEKVINLSDELHESIEEIINKKLDLNKSNPKIIICGGDGTLNWILSCLNTEQLKKVIISILPLGTGNDAANVMNFKKKWDN